MTDYLPPAVQKYIADVKEYVEPINRAQRETQRFALDADKAGLAADDAMKKASAGARDAAEAQKLAADAADKLKRGEIGVDEAARLAAEAVDKLTRANIAEREAAMMAADASDKQRTAYMRQAEEAAKADAVVYAANVKMLGSAQQHKKAVEDITKVFPDLKNASVDALKVEQSMSSKIGGALDSLSAKFKELGPLWQVGISEALLNLPSIMSVVGGGITMIFGGAFTAIGLMAQAKTAQVKETLKGLTTGLGDELKKITMPFQSTWTEIVKSAVDAFASIKPALSGFFANVAPIMSDFMHSFANALDGLNPMIDSLSTAFGNLMNDLGPKMIPIVDNFATGLKAIFDAVAQNPQAFTDFIVNVSKFFRYLGDGIGFLIKFKDEFNNLRDILLGPTLFEATTWIGDLASGIKSLIPGITGAKDKFDVADGTFKAFAGSAGTAADSMTEVKTKMVPMVSEMNTAALSADQLKQRFDALTGANTSVVQANINVKQAISDTEAAIKANGHTLDINTQKGRDNMTQVLAMARAFQDDIVAMHNHGDSASALQGRMNELRNAFIKLVTQMLGNKQKAKELADQLLGVAAASKAIPKTIHQDIYTTYHYSVSAHAATHDINTPVGSYGATGGLFSGGRFRYGDGGLVRGPGTGTSDSVPAPFVSNGEFVVNARQTRRFMPLLTAINKGSHGFSGSGWSKINQPTTLSAALTNWSGKGSWGPVGHPFYGSKTGEYRESHEAVDMLRRLRAGVSSAWGVAGGAGTGSGGVTQHVTNVNLYVAGDVRSDRDLKDYMQAALLQINVRNPTSGVSLPGGRVGG